MDKFVTTSVQTWLTLIQQQRSIAVIRAEQLNQGRNMAKAVAAGGMKLIEITWNSDRATDLIEQLRQDLPDCMIGTGTLLTLEQVQQAIAVGAQFLFTPHTNPAMIQAAGDRNIPIVPGALSPTEIITAWQAGATAVKVFPIQAVGGASYIKSLQGPLGQIPLIPTGGVSLENAKTFLDAGAIAVGLSGQLFPRAAIESGDWMQVTRLSRQLMQNLAGQFV
jgi:2-dehydro-3-deoxyphosphogluconate aldolase / (4S)-4-hydroxy-2-oxoglutarate aldolase